MRMLRLGLAAVILASVLPATCVLAGDEPVEKAVVADTAEKFGPLAAEIRNEMSPGGRYEYIKAHERSEVESGLDAMAALLGKSGSVAAMGDQDRIKLFNQQEQINGILTKSDNNRLVCERHAPVGSNIPITTCKTFGEIERARLATHRALDKTAIDQSVCNGAKACRSN